MPFPHLPVPPSALLDEIEAAELEGNDGRIEGVLCGAVKQLKATRAKPDGALYLSLMYLAKIKPNIFATEGVIEVRTGGPAEALALALRSSLPPHRPQATSPGSSLALPHVQGTASPMTRRLSQALCSLLRRDASINFKAKGNSLVSVLACNLLMAAYEEDENWPEIFVKVGPPLLGGSPGTSALLGVMGAERWAPGGKRGRPECALSGGCMSDGPGRLSPALVTGEVVRGSTCLGSSKG